MRKHFEKFRVYLGLAYLLVITYLLFFAPFRDGTFTEINLIPFKTLYTDIEQMFTGSPSAHFIRFTVTSVIGNIILLLPIPILFNIRWKGVMKWTLIFGAPIIIELLQCLLQVGSADMDDVMFNAFGCWVGFRLNAKLFPPKY